MYTNIHHPLILARTAGRFGLGLSRTSLIIIIVCGSVGTSLLFLIIFRLFQRTFRLREFRSAPLPPIQPLAHHRELHLAQFVDRIGGGSRPATWYDFSHLTVPPVFGSTSSSGSHVSLLHSDSLAVHSPASIGIFDRSNTSVDALVMNPQSPSYLDNPNPIQPAYAEVASLPDTPYSNTSSSHCNSITNNNLVPPSRSRSTSRPRSRPRPLSMTSTSATLTHRTSRTIRGTPHGPHSNVEIVLPTPLSSSLRPAVDLQSRRHTVMDGDTLDRSSSRLSVVDKWATLPVRSSSGKERRSLSFGVYTSSICLQNLSDIFQVNRMPQRICIRM